MPALTMTDASLIASDARPYVIGPVFSGLDGKFRIGNESADHADHVGLAAGYRMLGLLGLIDSTRGQHRDRDGFSHRFGKWQGGAGVDEHWWHDVGRAEQSMGAGRADICIIDEPIPIERPAGLNGVLELETIRIIFFPGNPDSDDEVVAGSLAHRTKGFAQEPHPCFGRPPISIGADIGARAQELRMQITHADQHLDAVGAGHVHPVGRGRETIDQILDHGGGHLTRHDVMALIGQGRWRNRNLLAAVDRMRPGSALVINLTKETAIMRGAELDNASQPRDTVIGGGGELRVALTLYRYHLICFRDQQTDASTDPRLVVRKPAVADGAGLRVAGAVGREEKPVLEAFPLYLERREKRGEQLAHKREPCIELPFANEASSIAKAVTIMSDFGGHPP